MWIYWKKFLRSARMNPIVLSICLTLHTLATILLAGNYLIAALVILPVLRRLAPEQEQSRLLPALVTGMRPWVLGSIGIFIVTGAWMMVADPQYTGFLQLTNTWSLLMYAKHLVVLGCIVLGVYLDMGIARRLAEPQNADRPGLLARFRLINGLTAAGCVIIVLMTGALQVM
jgi:uncharacterized membrane protein